MIFNRKFYTKKEERMKQAFEKRVLDLYREKNKLNKKVIDIDKRINHLENQISKLGSHKPVDEKKEKLEKRKDIINKLLN